MTSGDATWQRIERSELELPGVTAGTGFGRSAGLRIGGKIFAIRTDEGLVVKLSTARVDELVASGAGRSWGPGKRVMTEWVELVPDAAADWPAVVAEARAFVAG